MRGAWSGTMRGGHGWILTPRRGAGWRRKQSGRRRCGSWGICGRGHGMVLAIPVGPGAGPAVSALGAGAGAFVSVVPNRLPEPAAEAGRTGEQVGGFAWPGLDSDFYGVASWLAAHGGERRPSEPLSDWLKRAAEGSAARELGSPLNELLGLHYRYRFDPQGLSAAERGELKRKAEACLQGMQRISGDEVRR